MTEPDSVLQLNWPRGNIQCQGGISSLSPLASFLFLLIRPSCCY